MRRHAHSSQLQPIHFTIEASQSQIRPGEWVMPDTEIGVDYKTGKIVTAGCYGEVVAVNFSGGQHALRIAILPHAEFA